MNAFEKVEIPHAGTRSTATAVALSASLLWMLGLLILFPMSAAGQAPAADSPEKEEEDAVRAIARIYDDGVAYLEGICEDYRRIKAIELSRRRDISFAEAYDNITPVMPVLDPIDRELLSRPIYDPEKIAAHKDEIEHVEKQIDMMIELAAKLLEEIEKVKVIIESLPPPSPQQEKTLEEIVQQEEYDPTKEVVITAEARQVQPEMQQLEEAAQQEQLEEMKDLTPIMRPMLQLPDMEDLTEESQEADPVRTDLMVSGDDAGALNNIVNLDDLNKMTARKITLSGDPVEWMFIDTWYTVGPFPNPHRMNLDRKFPPESVIDLDAKYIGKGGKPIQWEFVQTGEAKCVPANDQEYAIYYAYTEIYLDQPMDLWVAIGSDDKANVWLNDMPIWISGDQLKGWKVNEGFRKVSFQPGVNRILFRVENGWMGTAFSFAIRTAS